MQEDPQRSIQRLLKQVQLATIGLHRNEITSEAVDLYRQQF